MDGLGDGKNTEDYFSWEASYSKVWSVILDDTSESIEDSINRFNSIKHKRLAKNLALIPGLKKGLIRNFVIVIEGSKAANETDLYPTRLRWTLNQVMKFSEDFFEQNPLCLLGVVLTKDAVAEKLSDLTSNRFYVMSLI